MLILSDHCGRENGQTVFFRKIIDKISSGYGAGLKKRTMPTIAINIAPIMAGR